MAVDPQGPSSHAGHVVRRVLLRRNIAIDAETAQLVADADAGVFPLLTAPLSSDRAGTDFPAPPAGRWRNRRRQ